MPQISDLLPTWETYTVFPNRKKDAMRSRVLTFSISAIAVVTLAGCSSSDTSTEATNSSSSSQQQFNDDDVMFAQMMIPHHEQAIEMSDIALDPTIGASDVVREIATEIKSAQDPEIAFMKGILTSWGKSVEMDASMDHSEMMDGMLTLDELTALGELRGSAFDTAWLEAMIRHHEGAVSMAQDVIEKGINQELIDLASKIIAAQQAEIDAMKALL
jgi:uncharacterized protein (DUF305 family)